MRTCVRACVCVRWQQIQHHPQRQFARFVYVKLNESSFQWTRSCKHSLERAFTVFSMAHLDLSVALTNYWQFVTEYYVKWCIVQLCTLSSDDVIVSHMCLRRIPQGRQRELKSHIPTRRDRQGKDGQSGIAGMLKPRDKAANISFRFFRKTVRSETVSYLLHVARLLLLPSSSSYGSSFSSSLFPILLFRSFPNAMQKDNL